jgi:BirA family biotin operon repressor/biotin-[acetyl-CoA-carboxylase] ligase
MAPSHRDAALTSLQIPGGRTLLIDNRIGTSDAASTLVSFAKRGAEEGYTVISDRLQGEIPSEGDMPRLHICTLLRPGKHTELAGVINAMGTVAASHAIERNSETRTQIRWLGDIHLERRRFSLRRQRRIATVFSQSLLLPSGFLDYMILHAVIDMPHSRFPLRMVDAVARIFTSRPVSNADHLTQAFLHDFFSMYDALFSPDGGKLPFWEEYRSRSLLLGKRVRFRDGRKRRRGRVLTVTDSGALLVVGKGGVRYEITSQSALL